MMPELDVRHFNLLLKRHFDPFSFSYLPALNDLSHNEEEAAADTWWRDTLIISGDFAVFRKYGDYSEKSVLRFAGSQGIAAGIVVGRMQSEKTICYNQFNDLKQQYEITI